MLKIDSAEAEEVSHRLLHAFFASPLLIVYFIIYCIMSL